MEYNLPATLDSQEATITTGQVVRATCIVALSAVVTVALSIGAYRLGVESASAGIYERQNTKIEAQNAGLLRLVGVVDQAKAREFSRFRGAAELCE